MPKPSKQALKIKLNEGYSVKKLGEFFGRASSTIIKYLKEYELATSLKQSGINRQKALSEGKKKYLGQICLENSQHGGIKYVTSMGCVKCASERQLLKKNKIRLETGRIPTKDKLIISKEEAYENLVQAINNDKSVYQGLKCDYGHQGIRVLDTGVKKGKNNKYIHGRCIDCRRSNGYYKKYGITVETYNEILQEQKGRCLICERKDSGREWDTHLLVEHDHISGRVRALTCHNCNGLIEKIENNKKNLDRVFNLLDSKIDYRDTETNKKTCQIIKQKNKRNKSHSVKGIAPSLKPYIKIIKSE